MGGGGSWAEGRLWGVAPTAILAVIPKLREEIRLPGHGPQGGKFVTGFHAPVILVGSKYSDNGSAVIFP